MYVQPSASTVKHPSGYILSIVFDSLCGIMLPIIREFFEP